MQVAEILSDLTSLQVCDREAAMALVRARPDDVNATQPAREEGSQDPDLKRAKDLFELHSTMAHQDGTDKDLDEARRAVARVYERL